MPRNAVDRRAGSIIPVRRTARRTRKRGRVFIDAIRMIGAGQELSYDYNLVLEERHTPKLKREHPCHCGMRDCRGTLLGKKR